MTTGFESDQLRTATEQVKATNKLATAINRLSDILESKQGKQSKGIET